MSLDEGILEHVPDLTHSMIGQLAAWRGRAVYFLIHESRVIYVGQSVDPRMRLRVHQKDKTFDRVLCLIPPDHVNPLRLEEAIINVLLPKHNGLTWYKNPTFVATLANNCWSFDGLDVPMEMRK